MAERPRFLCGVVEGRSCRSPRGRCLSGALQGLSRPPRSALRPGRAASREARRGPYPGNGGGSPSPARHGTLRPRVWNRQPLAKVPSNLIEHGCVPRIPSAAPSQHHGAAQGCAALAPAHCGGSFSLGTGPKPWGALLLHRCLQHSAVPGAGKGVLLLWQFRVALPPSAAVPACSSAPLRLGDAWHLLVRSISSFPGRASPQCSPLPAALPGAKTLQINTNQTKSVEMEKLIARRNMSQTRIVSVGKLTWERQGQRCCQQSCSRRRRFLESEGGRASLTLQ